MTNSNSSSAKAANSDRGKKNNGNTKKHTVRNSIIGVLIALIAVPALVFGTAYIVVDVPEPEELVTPQVSQIYASDGETELARVVPPEGNRQMVSLDSVPESVRNAVLAAEDREFYTNRGFSITGFARAALGQLTGNPSAGGGSTITQQYVKQAVVGNEHSYMRKARELVYSAKMANEWSKDEVLQAYLNTVYFGRNAYGVQAAAQAYFGRPVSELGPAEGAVLAASIQRPSELDPWTNPEGAESRWNYVLDGMVSIGALDTGERAELVFPETTDPANNRAYTEATGTNGLIKNHVIAELNELGISESDVDNRGLQITTTIDSVAQEATVDAVNNQMASQAENLRSAAVSVEPGTGAVRAYYGGEDASGWDFANAGLQTGSTFKIFALAAALQQGIPLSQPYSSAPITVGDATINNVEGADCGVCSIQDALKFSHNTSFIRLQQDLENGSQDTADMAHALGVAKSLPGIPETLTENGETPYEGIVLGQYQSRPLDMAVAMATIANNGVWHKPHFVERVETVNGELLYEHEPSAGERRVSEKVATNLLSAMGPIAAYSNGNALANGRPSASKTGTTQLGDTGYNRDAWMIGATPQMATAVWVGTEDNSPLLTQWGGNMYGSNVPASIWKQSLDGALINQPVEYFDSAMNLGYGNPPVPSVVWPPSNPTSSQEAPEPEETEEETSEPEPAPEAPLPDLQNDEGDIELAPGIVIPGDLFG